MPYRFTLFILASFLSLALHARTNQGTLNSLNSGFTLSEACHTDENERDCPSDAMMGLLGILDLATQNQCVASELDFQNKGLSLPPCPDEDDEIRGVDNTHPSGGMFVNYYGGNASFVHNLAKNFLEESEVGRFNVIISETAIDQLRDQPELLELLNNPRVNIINLPQAPRVKQWMRDSFQITTVNGRPSILQIEHPRENRAALEDRLACQIAQQCNIPHYVPPDFTENHQGQVSNLNMGGNLEVLPGGTFIRGIVGTSGHRHHLPRNETPPFQSPYQERQKASLEAAGNRVLDVDVSFTRVGHVDELFNIVRTNQPAPCHFAVMMASPRKGIELLEEFVSQQGEVNPGLQRARARYCNNNSFEELRDTYRRTIVQDENIQEVYDHQCFDDLTIQEFVSSEEFEILKIHNLVGEEADNIQSVAAVMENNRRLVEAELKATTQCEDPQFIEVPVIFRGGKAISPNQVNSFVETTSTSAPSHLLAPRTYVEPFDDYLKTEM